MHSNSYNNLTRSGKESSLSRRKFLKQTSAGLIGTQLVSAGLSGCTSTAESKTQLSSLTDGSNDDHDTNIYFGDLHTHTNLSIDASVRKDSEKGPGYAFAAAKRNRLDFAAVTDHTQGAVPDFPGWMKMLPSDTARTLSEGQEVFQQGVIHPWDWEINKKAVTQLYMPGQFVTLPAYEWSSTVWGDHNVYYLNDDEPVRYAWNLDDLYGALDGTECLMIPHHEGYQVGNRGANWDMVRDDRARVAEMFSIHGNSEEDGLGLDEWITCGMGPRCGGGTIRNGLNEGKKLGLIASTDNHWAYPGTYSHGLAAVQAKELTRENIYRAIKARRTYAVSGDRIILDFRLNGKPMGSILRSSKHKKRQLRVFVDSWQCIETIEIFKNGKLLKQVFGFENRLNKKADRFKVALHWGWNVHRDKTDKWNLNVSVKNGEIKGLQPCFGDQAPEQEIQSQNNYELQLYSPLPANYFQGLRLDVLGDTSTEIIIKRDGNQCMSGTIGELLVNSKSNQPFGIFQGAVYLSRAFSEPQFKAMINFVDETGANQSTDYYYLRVKQKNGHKAWSSPIWVRSA